MWLWYREVFKEDADEIVLKPDGGRYELGEESRTLAGEIVNLDRARTWNKVMGRLARVRQSWKKHGPVQ